MEQQFAEMQQALSELQEKLAEKDVQIAMYEQDLSSVNEHSTVGGTPSVVSAGALEGWMGHTPGCGLHLGDDGRWLEVMHAPALCACSSAWL